MDALKDWGFESFEFGESYDDDSPIDDLSDSIEMQYKLEISLSDESEQEKLYNELTQKGYSCRILTL